MQRSSRSNTITPLPKLAVMLSKKERSWANSCSNFLRLVMSVRTEMYSLGKPLASKNGTMVAATQ